MIIFKKLVIYNWLKSFFMATAVLLFIIVLTNIVNALMREIVTFDQALTNLFFEMPIWIKNLFPFSCLLATLFSLEGLKTRNELVALISCGYSSKRVVFDIFQISFLIMAFVLINNFVVLPKFSKMRIEWLRNNIVHIDEKSVGDVDVATSFGDQFWVKTKDAFYSFKHFDKNEQVLRNLSMYKVQNGKITQMLTADKGKFLGDGKWRLKKGSVINELEKFDFPKTILIEDKDMKLGLSSSQLGWVGEKIKTMNVLSLIRYIAFLKNAEVDISGLLVYISGLINSALICIIFSLIPLNPLFSMSRRTGGIGMNVVFTLIFSASYWLINSFFVTLGASATINPVFAVFFTSLVFIGYIVMQIKKKLSLMQ